ncbi:MAG: hypothetical protein ACLFN5_03825 [bacterium]
MKKINNNPRLSVLIAAVLLMVVSYGTMWADYPLPMSPFSFPVILPTLLIGGLLGGELWGLAVLLGCSLVPLFFLLWSFPLFYGRKKISLRSKILVFIFVVLSALFLIFSWQYGINYQGKLHTVLMYVYNAVFWLLLLLVGRRNSLSPTFTTNLIFHWLFFAWLAWVSFPWLGELI